MNEKQKCSGPEYIKKSLQFVLVTDCTTLCGPFSGGSGACSPALGVMSSGSLAPIGDRSQVQELEFVSW